jgi:hypothetical protein
VFLGRRPRQLANEREKLLRAYYADAVDVTRLMREQARINAGVTKAESQLANDGKKLAQAKQNHRPRAQPGEGLRGELPEGEARGAQMWNPAFFRTIRIRDGAIADFTYEEPFASLLGSHKGSMVETAGLEPATSCLQSRCSTN